MSIQLGASIKLSRREATFAVLAIVSLLGVVLLYYLSVEQVSAQEELSRNIRRAKRVLEETQASSNTAPLEAQKSKLSESLSSSAFAPLDGGKFTLSLWSQANESNVKLRQLSYTPSKAVLAGSNLVTHTYVLKLSGDPKGLHGFLSSATSSQYATFVRRLTLNPVQDGSDWQLDLDLIVLAQVQ